MRRLKLFSLLLLLFIGVGHVWATETPVLTADFTAKTDGKSDYKSSWTYGNFTIVNAANNNKGWAYMKFGGKSADIGTYNPCYVVSPLVTVAIKSIDVITNSGNLTKGSVNGWGVYVYSDANCTNEIAHVTGGEMTAKTAETLTLTPTSPGTSWPANSYYKVYFDLANTTTTNGIVWVDKINWYEYSSGGQQQPTLSSIQVSTPPSEVTYTEGESFDPTGLVITRNFDNSTNDTYAYAGHTSEFSFTPSLSTALATTDASVTITYGGKSTSQAITVNANGGGGSGSGDDETDVLTSSDLTATTTSYEDFSGVTKNSDAVYAGSSAKSSSGGIQLRSKNSNSGIITTTSGGVVKSVTITVESGSNTIDIYGSNSAYTAASDLFGSNAGTKVGSLTATGTITFTDDYAYVGIRSNNGAVYLTSVEIEWTPGSGDAPTPVAVTGVSLNKTSTSLAPNEQETLIATVAPNDATNKNVSWSTSNSNVATVTNGTVTAVAPGNATITVTTEDGEETATCEVTVVKAICFDFEASTAHRTSGNNSYAEGPQEYEQHNSNISCTYMDVVTDGGPLAGTANAKGRIASNSTNISVLLLGPINIGGKKITGVSYLTKGVAAMSQTCSYSLNNSDWEDLLTIESMPTLSTKESVSDKNITGTNLYLKIATTVASSIGSNRDFQIDNVILYYDDVTYSIAFDANGGTGTMNPISSIIYNASQELTANTFTREGYDFAGWATSANGEKAYDNSATIEHVTGDMTLYAVWTAKTYAITLDKNEGDSDGSAQATYDSNTLADITHAARSAWNLLGYFAATDGDVKIINADGTLVSGIEGYTDNTGNWIKATDCKLYAHWEEIEDPIVTTNPTSVSFTSVAKEAEKPAAKTFVITGSNLTENLSLSAYVEADYYTWEVTDGSLEKDANGAVSATVTVTPKDGITEDAGDKDATITISGGGLEANVVVNVTFNVQETYTVNWYVNSDDPAHTQTAVAGTQLTDIPSVTPSDACADFTFEGWKVGAIATSQTTAPDYVDLENITMPEGGADYYAVFKEEGEPGKVTTTDELNRAFTGRPESSTYDTWTGKAGSASDAIYAGQSAGENNAIQLRSNNSNSGIVTTTSGGKAKKVTVTWEEHTAATRTISIYGKNSAYSAATDLYNNSNQGTLLGELCVDDAVSDISVLSIEGEYEYIGIRSKSGALYLAEVEIDWETEGEPSYTYVTTCVACSKVTFDKAGEGDGNTFALQVNSANVEFVKTCDAGASVNVVASPAEGYEMTNVEVSDVTGASYSDGVISIPQNATGTLTVTATFAPKAYSVTMAQEGGAEATISENQSNKHYGDEITVTAIAKDGYEFIGWSASPAVEFANAKALSTTFDMPNGDVTVTAKFAQKLTVAEAIALIPNTNDVSEYDVCVEGIVCTAGTSVSSGKMIYYISDNGQETNKLQIYNGKGLANADFAATTDIKVGDKVVVCGKLKNFGGSPEVNSPNYIFSRTEGAHGSYEIAGELGESHFAAGDQWQSSYLSALKVNDVYNTGYKVDVTSEFTITADKANEAVLATEDTEIIVTATNKANTELTVVKAFTIEVSAASLTDIALKADDNEYQTKTVYYLGDEFVAPTIVATLSYGGPIEGVATYVSGFDNTTAGTQEVTVSYTRGTVTKTAKYNITMKAIYGNENDPHTVAKAIEFIGTNTTESTELMYVKGIVSQVNQNVNSDGTFTYYISDNGSTTGHLNIYNGKYINNANFTTETKVMVGDEVVVKGKTLYYCKNSNCKPELTGSELLSIAREPEFEVADVAEALEVNISEDLGVEGLTITKDGEGEVTLVSSDATKVSIVDGKLHAVAAAENVEITAKLAANGIYKAATTTFHVTVIAERTRYAVTFDLNEGSASVTPTLENQLAGATVEIPTGTYTKDNSKFTGWVVKETETPQNTVTVSKTGDVYSFTMPAAAVTVTAQWTPVEMCAISFQVNGNEVATASVPQETEYEIPENTTHPTVDGFTFLGWSETAVATDTEDAQTLITSYTPEAGESTKVLYGIYSHVEQGANYGKYVKVASEPEDWSGQYLIVYETDKVAFDGSLATLDAAGNSIAVTIANEVVIATTTDGKTLDGSSFTIAKAETNYSIHSASGKYIGRTANSNGFNESATESYNHSISLTKDGFAITSSAGPKLQYLKSGNNSQFRYYSSSQKAIALYKKNVGTTVYTSSPVEKTIPVLAINNGSMDLSENLTLSSLIQTNESGATVSFEMEENENAEIADGIFTAVVAGSYTITASVPETKTYKAASTTITVTVSKVVPTLQFAAASVKANETLDLTNYVTVNGDNLGAKTFQFVGTVSEDYALIEGNEFIATTVGTYTVQVTVAETDYYQSKSATAEITVYSGYVVNISQEAGGIVTASATGNEFVDNKLLDVTSGTEVTLSYQMTDADHYEFVEWMAAGVTSGDDIAIDEDGKFMMPDEDVEVIVSYRHFNTVTFDNNGRLNPLKVYEGNPVVEDNIPATGGLTVAWYNGANKVTFPYTPTEDVTLVAKFTQVVGTKFAKVTALNDIMPGRYVIVNDGFYLPNTTTSSAPVASNSTKATIVDDEVTNVIDEMVWNFTGTNSAMTITNADGKYLYETANNNGLRVGTTTDTWAFETNGVGFALKGATNSRYCAVYNSQDWRSYTSKGAQNYHDGGKVYLYKEVDNEVEVTAPTIVVETTAYSEDVIDEGFNGIVVVPENVTFTINTETEVSGVVVESGATVVVEAELTSDSLIVEDGAVVELQETVSTPVFRISAAPGQETVTSSGELYGAQHLAVPTGDIYMDFQLVASGMDADYWYSISAPFNVNVNNDIYMTDGTHLVNNTHIQVWEFAPDQYANGGRGWKRVNQMKRGMAYLIGFDETACAELGGVPSVVRLRANLTALVADVESFSLTQQNGSASDPERASYAYNGLSNPNTHHVGVTNQYQYYDNVNHQFQKGTATNLVVGTPFFCAYSPTTKVVALGNTPYASAPMRNAENEYKFNVQIRKPGSIYYDNQMCVRASEDALSTFEEGKDMVTMNETCSRTAAAIWTNAYGKRLAVEEAPLVNNQAIYDLTVMTPAAGTYVLRQASEVDGADLYVTYEGAIVWNLSLGDYELDLTKGTTTGYGLLLVVQPNQMPTGVENGELLNGENGVQKILLNGNLYILRDGHVYDAVGKQAR